nr:hypothetical protein CFP56_02514 [Quercus suber]
MTGCGTGYNCWLRQPHPDTGYVASRCGVRVALTPVVKLLEPLGDADGAPILGISGCLPKPPESTNPTDADATTFCMDAPHRVYRVSDISCLPKRLRVCRRLSSISCRCHYCCAHAGVCHASYASSVPVLLPAHIQASVVCVFASAIHLMPVLMFANLNPEVQKSESRDWHEKAPSRHLSIIVPHSS